MSEHEAEKTEAEDAQTPAEGPAEPAAEEPVPEDAADATADETAADADGDGTETEAAPEDAAAADDVDPAVRMEELEAQVGELNDKLLRALAESENVRRRAQRDKEDTAKYGIKNFAEGMLSIADNLGRAMASIDADARAQDANLENIFVGVEMVQKDLIATFERYGITPIKALGAKFDPMQHEAMYEIEDPQSPAGTIAQVLEPGYVLHGRTLRAAKVGITKGGPKETPTAVAPAADADGAAGDAAADDGDTADPATREGQAAYENQADPKTTSGGNLDQEL